MTATDHMFRAEYTATLLRLAADTHATAPVALADALLRNLHDDNPPTYDDGLQYRLSLPEAPHIANDTYGRHRPPSPPSRPRKRRAQPTSTSTTRVVRRLPTPPPIACSPTPSPTLRGRDAFLQDNALRIVDVPADGSCGFTAVAVAMGIIPPPTFGLSISHNRHTWDLLNQLRTLAATQLLHSSDVRQLYSKEFLFLEGTTDLDDEIQNMLRPTLDEEPPSPGTILPVSSWMLYSTLRVFAIAFERPFIILFDNAEYPCFEFFCHHRGECNFTATALDAKHATMEELRFHLKEEHPATAPPIVVMADGKDPTSTLTHCQACVPS